ncbi:response regulator transcription factor [Actinospica sp. MGRD01-02]|uniref:Response regulator transcription factor n=1 Tax=Actinospica acidithermotolerans TaxID=2828514 RepID=A0A941E8X6_9ACTN|nr:response regulator transcription factor [Actinospica acidithermotolerans]MBR7825700.1 response regulator transcription factor [Actinospica acidithermotolerans]
MSLTMREYRGERAASLRGGGQQVLVAVGDPGESELLAATLDLAGYRVLVAESGAELMALFVRRRPDLVVLDLDLPGIAELGRGRRIAPAERPPVLFLAANDSAPTMVRELAAGEADYVTRPLRIREVLARLQALLSAPGKQVLQRYGDLVLDDAICLARRGQNVLALTPAEYRLLRHLLVNAGRVLSKEQVSLHVWGEVRDGNAVEQLVSRLRRKVNQSGPALIRTRRGFGYTLGRCAPPVPDSRRNPA